ncbi:hypothetical protein PV325_008480 [Microctonus aethiopoides]|uniref:Uncharacterized protein n=1 Tax=Microctonus aethiopoides TaxID=144406 RepID=A0AA39C7Q4_9HYME|nr:hypothetical protein PV325_008480 [Microctonus aethiopoides]KAK0081157.1 hypothetical protein PV326_007830 [Microctonus aethiopoides]KAK0159445.1 hypothetical protein PV328_010321 [Microctonus aethiopoides]
MAKTKKKQTREERLEKKREAERLRYQRIKCDPGKNEQLKEKEKLKYQRKKENGRIKSINDMTEREQRTIRKIWREKTKKHRDHLKLQSIANSPMTPPSSNNDAHSLVIEAENNVALAAKKRSENQRKSRNRLLKKQKDEIERLRNKVKKFQKKLRRVEKQKMTPNSKVVDLMKNNNEEKVEEVKKKLLFSEVVQSQLKKNIELIKNDEEMQIFKKVLSGDIVKKYKVLDQINVKPLTRSPTTEKSLLDMTRKTRKDKIDLKLKKVVAEFLEEDCNSRLCPGKKDSISRNTIKK